MTENYEPLIGPGHAAGDILGAPDWKVLERSDGRLRVEAPLLDRLKNPVGQLFGGFTTTYVDLMSVMAAHTDNDRDAWLTTINIRCDFIEPIVADTFVMTSEIINRRGRTLLIATSFHQGDTMAAYALATVREIDLQEPVL